MKKYMDVWRNYTDSGPVVWVLDAVNAGTVLVFDDGGERWRYTIMTPQGEVHCKWGDWLIRCDDGSIVTCSDEMLQKALSLIVRP